ncbi:transposase family protein [Streptomyces sp. NPDC059467]|uniref:transposase family protein n=1 Tax=Streptomyces sp. NPDC059467 TaxID=3346844 RepID=UPI0036A19520
MLARLRNDGRLAGGNAVSASTLRRRVLEVIELLAARSPRLDRALAKAAKDSGCVVLMDGTLIRTRPRSGRANRKNYSAAVADLGFVGLDEGAEEQPAIITGFKASGGKRLSTPKKVVNRLISSLRAPVERGFASRKTFRILTKVRMQPRHTTALLRALLVPTRHQVAR